MGAHVSSIWKGEPRKFVLVIVGLAGGGKTTVFNQLRGDDASGPPEATVGFNHDIISFGDNLDIQLWDISGASVSIPFWRCFYADAHALLFVVDSTDPDRAATAGGALIQILQDPFLPGGCPLLILSNKHDLDTAMDNSGLTEAMGIEPILKETTREWAIIQCIAQEGIGLEETTTWLLDRLLGGTYGSF
ncbi:ADP-ribosylation factor family-domain-containing protein [Polychytrium aggregatum]|uniref:ADP-ribosylation factor family-domain-containing protein n=1 Tax=Polychytrium aggregatum TaxID=110093 RepID=UPI0022FDF106|nr:ADP-ribosylation factor family-domain-containing protein [Polychytrium aggregatum]KAI9193141.1 ADP-ribosylation factor family-domain-containing protein [Polychytrium aggregatum]